LELLTLAVMDVLFRYPVKFTNAIFDISIILVPEYEPLLPLSSVIASLESAP
jgi:hypothetical protein